MSNVCKTCFFWLRHLRRVRRSLNVESVKTLVDAPVALRVDYCNCVFASTSKRVTDKLQFVNVAARLITETQKYKRVRTRLMHDDLHWMTVPQGLQYKLAVTVHCCLQFSTDLQYMYTFIHHEGSTVYIQSKTDRKLLLQTDKKHTHRKDNSPAISTDNRLPNITNTKAPT